MTRVVLAFICSFLLLPFQVWAADYPDFLTFGLGDFDFDKQQDRRSVDYRAEYEWGLSLLPWMASSLNVVDPYLQLHPVLGIEGNTKGTLYGNGGLALDIPILTHGIFTWGETLGAFDPGNDERYLGSPIEFRSQVELGWRFDNQMRLTGYLSHISNAGLTHENPGAEIVGAYFHIPVAWAGR